MWYIINALPQLLPVDACNVMWTSVVVLDLVNVVLLEQFIIHPNNSFTASKRPSSMYYARGLVLKLRSVYRSIMAEGIRRNAPDERRIRAREAKLMERELEYASRMGWRKILCPCTIHGRDRRSGLVPRSYRRCLRKNGRHVWFFRRSEVGALEC